MAKEENPLVGREEKVVEGLFWTIFTARTRLRIKVSGENPECPFDPSV